MECDCGFFGIFVRIYLFRVLAMICGLLQVGEFIFYAWWFARIPTLKYGKFYRKKLKINVLTS
jgi:hypothetical protein